MPNDFPQFWETVAKFGNLASSKQEITAESARITVENIQALKPNIFISDSELINQMVQMEYSVTGKQLGIPLVSDEKTCLVCGGLLLMRNDRPSYLTLYTESMGTVCATQFYKYCQNYRKGCNFTQYYGYHNLGNRKVRYNDTWMSLPYFVSTQETGFEMSLLKRFDLELLIGQLSYKQKADIYNVYEGYDTTKKTCSSTKTERPSHKTPVHRYVCQYVSTYIHNYMCMEFINKLFECYLLNAVYKGRKVSQLTTQCVKTFVILIISILLIRLA